MANEIGASNKAIYRSQSGVESYIETALQPAEAAIVAKYQENLQNKHILDIGCGAGRTSIHLKTFTPHYVGVDYSEEMIAYCQTSYPELEFQVSDARDMSRFAAEQFDFILFSYNGIDYVNHADRLTILQQIRRLLKRDGLFVFSTHNRSFRRIITAPVFHFRLNPLSLAAETLSYLKKQSNRRRLAPLQVEDDQYAIINESGNDFGLLTYYISRQAQIEQLTAAGFTTIETYALDGRLLSPQDDDSDSCWIYYVTRLQG